jgi:hypothetical protein
LDTASRGPSAPPSAPPSVQPSALPSVQLSAGGAVMPTALPAAAGGEPARDEDLLAVAEGSPELRGWTLVPLGRFQRGSREALIVWPALDAAGRVGRGAGLGLAFDRGADGRYRLAGGTFGVAGAAAMPAALAAALGGADYTMSPREQGAPRDALGPALAERCRAVAAAARAGDRTAVTDHARSLTSLLALDLAAFDNAGPHLLSLCASGYDIGHVATEPNGEGAEVRVRLRRGSSRFRLRVGAYPLRGHGDLWVVTALGWTGASQAGP